MLFVLCESGPDICSRLILHLVANRDRKLTFEVEESSLLLSEDSLLISTLTTNGQP